MTETSTPVNPRTLWTCVLVLSRLGRGTDRADTSESPVRPLRVRWRRRWWLMLMVATAVVDD